MRSLLPALALATLLVASGCGQAPPPKTPGINLKPRPSAPPPGAAPATPAPGEPAPAASARPGQAAPAPAAQEIEESGVVSRVGPQRQEFTLTLPDRTRRELGVALDLLVSPRGKSREHLVKGAKVKVRYVNEGGLLEALSIEFLD